MLFAFMSCVRKSSFSVLVVSFAGSESRSYRMKKAKCTSRVLQWGFFSPFQLSSHEQLSFFARIEESRRADEWFRGTIS